MPDHFALLNEPRRTWLDLESLKSKFLAASAGAHPDRVHGAGAEQKAEANERYAALNAAYNCLREPKDRLAHLLECESGRLLKDVRRIPPGTMDFFMVAGQTCREADTFLAEREKVTSPLLKVRLFEKGMEWTDRLNGLLGKINTKRDVLLAEVRELDRAWESAPPVGSPQRASALPLDRLEEICRSLSYVARWTEQLQERLVRLSID